MDIKPHNTITKLCHQYHAQLMLVTKHKTLNAFEPFLQNGQRLFGENYVQEAALKWPAIQERYPDIELHLIGRLQTNKTQEAIALFDCIQTIDRPKLARAISQAEQSLGLKRKYYIQINIGNEPQKGGILLDEFASFYTYCMSELHLNIVGIMTIPPASETPEDYFKSINTLANHHKIKHISMGMSGDYEAALAHGSTMIRIGSLLLGRRG